jgi:hypothetical protein
MAIPTQIIDQREYVIRQLKQLYSHLTNKSIHNLITIYNIKYEEIKPFPLFVYKKLVCKNKRLK